eukprot:3211967-Amphidinium_carterae.1
MIHKGFNCPKLRTKLGRVGSQPSSERTRAWGTFRKKRERRGAAAACDMLRKLSFKSIHTYRNFTTRASQLPQTSDDQLETVAPWPT